MYAVVDVETTGLGPRTNRIAEIAVVLVDERGEIERTWCTLINPERDLGPQHIHGISASDVLFAPTFGQVAGQLSEMLSARILVAHNVTFDLRFLTVMGRGNRHSTDGRRDDRHSGDRQLQEAVR